MATAIIILAFIALFIAFIVLVQFPEIATQIYTIIESLINYISNGTGIIWFLFPKTLTLIVFNLVIGIEVTIRALKIFLWIYDKLKNG